MDGQHMTWSTCRTVEIKAIQREPNRNDSADKVFLAQGGDGGCFQSSRRLDPPKTRTGLDRDHFSTTQEPRNDDTRSPRIVLRFTSCLCPPPPPLFYCHPLICPGLFSPVFLWPLVSIVLVSFCLCWLIVSFTAFHHCGFRSIVACCQSLSRLPRLFFFLWSFPFCFRFIFPLRTPLI